MAIAWSDGEQDEQRVGGEAEVRVDPVVHELDEPEPQEHVSPTGRKTRSGLYDSVMRTTWSR